jgi:hypothetical protein
MRLAGAALPMRPARALPMRLAAAALPNRPARGLPMRLAMAGNVAVNWRVGDE